MNSGWFEALQKTSAFQFMSEQNVTLISPEFILLMTILFAVITSFSDRANDRRDTFWLALAGTAFSMAILLFHLFNLYIPNVAEGHIEWLSRPVFYGMLHADLFAVLFRGLILSGLLLILLMSRRYIEQMTENELLGEFYVILLTAALGGMFLVAANDLVMLFVALETLGIASYILVGYLRRTYESAEASLKYLIFGGMSTAMILFGFSLLYGASGGITNLSDIGLMLQHLPAGFTMFIPLMAVMILGGIAFKLSLVPFHMWTPDVYEGAPTPVTAFLSVVSKTAAFAFAIRLILGVMGILPGWFFVLAAISVASMVVGNFVALRQTNVKRLLAYSTIAHAGYMLLPLVILPNGTGLSSLLYYLMVYLFMNIGAFGCIVAFQKETGKEGIADYAGLFTKRPLLAFAFSIFLLSLAGIPITAGFFGKFFLFQAVIKASLNNLWIVFVALLASTVSLYYYVNVIRLMIVAEPSEAVQALSPRSLNCSLMLKTAIGVSLTATLFLGIFGSNVLSFCHWAAYPYMNAGYKMQAQQPAVSDSSQTKLVQAATVTASQE